MPQYPSWSRLIHQDEVPEKLPEGQGLYKLYWATSDGVSLQYIGEASNLHRRLGQWRDYRFWNYCEFAQTTGYSQKRRRGLEVRLISLHKPPYNEKGW